MKNGRFGEFFVITLFIINSEKEKAGSCGIVRKY